MNKKWCRSRDSSLNWYVFLEHLTPSPSSPLHLRRVYRLSRRVDLKHLSLRTLYSDFIVLLLLLLLYIRTLLFNCYGFWRANARTCCLALIAIFQIFWFVRGYLWNYCIFMVEMYATLEDHIFSSPSFKKFESLGGTLKLLHIYGWNLCDGRTTFFDVCEIV